MAAALKRIAKEMTKLQSDISNPAAPQSHSIAAVVPNEADVKRWRVLLRGPDGTPYAGGWFVVEITFSESYPHAAPALQFITPTFSAYVDPADGKLCEGLLEGWQPTQTVAQALDRVVSVVFQCESSGTAVLNVEASQLAEKSPAAFQAACKKWCAEHAKKQNADAWLHFQRQ